MTSLYLPPAGGGAFVNEDQVQITTMKSWGDLTWVIGASEFSCARRWRFSVSPLKNYELDFVTER